MSEYLNKNGLVQGLIPANTACPFLNKCKFKVHTCPGVEGKMKPNSFPCAAARLHSAISESDHAPTFQNKAKGIVEIQAPSGPESQDDPTLFEIHKKPTYITFSSMRAVKEPKK